ncbi:MAG: dihydropteroate synthase [Helicobacteraceae bacterium]|nr:dihydropteroate synthase [Helicobacteraceae bacterium]
MFIKKLKDLKDLKNIGATSFATSCGKKKGGILYFEISNLKLSATIILKQEAISAGGDFIVPKDMILCKDESYSGILIATHSQIKHIINKCATQPFNLKHLSQILQSHIKMESHSSNNHQIMGIINITNDSFYEDSRINQIDTFITKVRDMIECGVEIIDIGAASSRPGSEYVESSIEIAKLKKPLSILKSEGLIDKAIFSIDSYNYDTARFCVDFGFKIINDVYGLKDMRLANLAIDSKNKIILMHNSFINPHNGDIIQNVDEFFNKRLDSLFSLGLKKEQIILDIGFGFGKNTKENVDLIKYLEHFKHFGCEILVGASRKRSIGEITQKDTKDRLFGTLSLHQIALDRGANIIRCHDYKEHIDMLKIWQKINKD